MRLHGEMEALLTTTAWSGHMAISSRRDRGYLRTGAGRGAGEAASRRRVETCYRS
jgi:hypothetical protein